MFLKFIIFYKCIFGPRLYQLYGGDSVQKAFLYTPNTLESICEAYFRIVSVGLHSLKWLSPFWIPWLYSKGYLSYINFSSFFRLCANSLGSLIIIRFLRGLGRFVNPVYYDFCKDLIDADSSISERKKLLSSYDFCINNFEPCFRAENIPIITRERLLRKGWINTEDYSSLPLDLLSYFLIYTIGIRLTYPGAYFFLHAGMHSTLLDGRASLVSIFKAKREVIYTANGTTIDLMFVDRRCSQNDDKLLICCEGNAGFYEIGSVFYLLETNFSVVGWNHPGFGESTGYPSQYNEELAISAVFDYCTQILGFENDNINVYGWSIGGYSASFICANHPSIHSVILDAAFDDIVPLAGKTIPFAASIVERSLKCCLHLNNVPLLKKYPGKIKFIRRVHDEIMCTVHGVIGSNRTNVLVTELLKYRYPEIIEKEMSLINCYLSCDDEAKESLCQEYDTPKTREMLETNYELYKEFPCDMGSSWTGDVRKCAAIFLLKKYMVDFSALHCTKLPSSFLSIP